MLAAADAASVKNPLAAKRPHYQARAKRVIFLFMQGGPSQVDTFDYKPILEKRHGEKMPFDDDRVIEFRKTRKRTNPDAISLEVSSVW